MISHTIDHPTLGKCLTAQMDSSCLPTNLQILCANCHRLKTHFSKDHMNAGQIGVRDIDDKDVVTTNTKLPNK